MWQFAEAVRGLADGCLQLGTPVTGGNVSFYNQTGTTPILPTPVIGVLGVIDDVARRAAAGLPRPTARSIYLLGETRDEFGGSEWAHVVHGFLGGRPPVVDLAREKLLADVLDRRRARRPARLGARPSDGGLAQALVECVPARRRRRAHRRCPTGVDPFVALFSESAGACWSSVPRSDEVRVHRHVRRARAARARASASSTCSTIDLEVQGQFTHPAARAAHGLDGDAAGTASSDDRAPPPRSPRTPRRRRRRRLARGAARRGVRRAVRPAGVGRAHAGRAPRRQQGGPRRADLGTPAAGAGAPAGAVRAGLRARRGRHHRGTRGDRRRRRPDRAARALRDAGRRRRTWPTPRWSPGRAARSPRSTGPAPGSLDLVVHSDDLSRSLPDRAPVPLPRPALAAAVRTLAEILAAQAPGRSVEVRVRRSSRCRPSPAPGTPAARRRTSSRPTPSPGCASPPAAGLRRRARRRRGARHRQPRRPHRPPARAGLTALPRTAAELRGARGRPPREERAGWECGQSVDGPGPLRTR